MRAWTAARPRSATARTHNYSHVPARYLMCDPCLLTPGDPCTSIGTAIARVFSPAKRMTHAWQAFMATREHQPRLLHTCSGAQQRWGTRCFTHTPYLTPGSCLPTTSPRHHRTYTILTYASQHACCYQDTHAARRLAASFALLYGQVQVEVERLDAQERGLLVALEVCRLLVDLHDMARVKAEISSMRACSVVCHDASVRTCNGTSPCFARGKELTVAVQGDETLRKPCARYQNHRCRLCRAPGASHWRIGRIARTGPGPLPPPPPAPPASRGRS